MWVGARRSRKSAPAVTSTDFRGSSLPTPRTPSGQMVREILGFFLANVLVSGPLRRNTSRVYSRSPGSVDLCTLTGGLFGRAIDIPFRAQVPSVRLTTLRSRTASPDTQLG